MKDIGTDRWQLPDGVNEILPKAAIQVERLRRLIMDRCELGGFDYVMPPPIEYLDSLLTGTGETLDLQTFKLVDQNDGRTLGFRADMTPQVARIDAHTLRSELPTRLFYTGTVLRAQADRAGGSRNPMQFGAELFGHAGADSDIEIIRLMLDAVLITGIPTQDLLLDLGHVGVFRSLAMAADLSQIEQNKLFAALHHGSVPELNALIDDLLSEDVANPAALSLMRILPTLSGDISTIANARELLQAAGSDVIKTIDTLARVVDALRHTHPEINIHIDLSELRGYRYHTGMVFSLYTTEGHELARGGRYDAIGKAFGYSRPATGFSGDLVQLAEASRLIHEPGRVAAIFAADDAATEAWDTIKALRAAGERVIVSLPGSGETPDSCGCDRILSKQQDRWIVQPVNS